MENLSSFSAVILAAGRGSRLHPLAQSSKTLIPILDKSLFERHLDFLTEAGIQSVITVINGEKTLFQEVCRKEKYMSLNCRFLVQEMPKGIADALMLCRQVVSDKMLVLLADTYFEHTNIKSMVNDVTKKFSNGADAIINVRPVEDPRQITRECTIEFHRDGLLKQIIEKPETPLNNLKPCGMYFFNSSVFKAIQATPPSLRSGELEITDAIQRLSDLGGQITHGENVRFDININTPDQYLAANLHVLNTMEQNVYTGSNVTIGNDVTLTNCVIFDNTTIEGNMQMKNTLILPGSSLYGHGEYSDCILGTKMEHVAMSNNADTR